MVADVQPVEQQQPPKLAIEAVWSRDEPYPVAGGHRFFVGTHVGDGWTIDRIGPEEIVFKRGDKTFPDYSLFSSEIVLGFAWKSKRRKPFNGIDIGIRSEGP